ncbi:MAG: cytochrome c biogenesis protein CcsA [Verrucomicrobiales bacterium]|nr:cytochrome c biogenesis protein CcsA [Verrucomicrobiales bacterium]
MIASPVLFGLGVFGLMPALDTRGPAEPQFWQGLASLHASVTLLAYGTLGLAALAATMHLTQIHDLKHRKLRAFSSFLPSVQRLERVTTWLVVAGFALLTVGSMFGAGWLRHEKGTAFIADPKIIWTAVVWLGYAALLVAHWRGVRTGRRFAWSVVGAFAFVMLTFWGTNLISPIHHP